MIQPATPGLPPLALYIHVPWCVRKCPYCDFNSHQVDGALPDAAYIDALLADLDVDLPHARQREITSIFIGGGTPSLLPATAYERLLDGLARRLHFAKNIEITLEANPGTTEQQKFRDYRQLGINRLSIGIQSFDDTRLRALGRIHGGGEAIHAAQMARAAGFDNFNIDLMHGLPGQSVADALADLQQAIALAPSHLSWYQLTVEPNTVFAARPPALPDDDLLADIEDAGFALLADVGLRRYEISAFSRDGYACRHNMNYWTFGDYLGIGAGAHGKITLADGQVFRCRKKRLPKEYLAAANQAEAVSKPFTGQRKIVPSSALPFEFMLNALRLVDGVDASLFAARTGLDESSISTSLQQLRARGLLDIDHSRIACTDTGLRFLNDVVNAFA